MGSANDAARWLFWMAAVTALLLLPPRSQAHCDGLDGPVVKAARAALETGNLNRALIWVRKGDEPELREAFTRTLAVRKLSAESRALADSYFFETLVRIHRAGEGEPYTGLKPAGRDLGPAIPAADAALEKGSAGAVVELLTHAMHEAVSGPFEVARSKRGFKPDDVEAGRAYVEAYVRFLHTVERMHGATRGGASEHSEGH